MDNKKINPLTNTWVVALLALMCCALWGSAFPFIKVGYSLFKIDSSIIPDVILFAGMRFTIAGILVILFISVKNKRLFKPKSNEIGKIATLSLFQTVLQYSFFYIGLSNTTSMKASIIFGSNVFLVILISCLVFKEEKYTLPKFIGSIIGFAGIIVVNLSGGGINTSFNFMGDGFILVSSISYAFSSAFLKRYSKSNDTVLLSAYQFLFGGIILCIIGLIAGGKISYFSIKAVTMLMYLGFLSATAYTVWSVLISNNDVSRVAVYGFSNPIFGVLLSRIFLPYENSSIGINVFFALALVCTGIFIINSKKSNIDELKVKHV